MAGFAAHEITLRTNRRATRLDTTRHAVTLDSGEDILYDQLLLATGASPRHLDIPGRDLPNLFYLRTLQDADRLHHAIAQAQREGRPHPSGRGRAVVIGAGLLGVELAASLSRLSLGVDIVSAGEQPWHSFAGPAFGRFVASHLEHSGVRLRLQTAPGPPGR